MTAPAIRIGHAHLKVRDLKRSVDFYTRLLGWRVTEQVSDYAFLTGGDAHHELALQALGPGASSPSHRSVGLYHVAFEVADRETFMKAVAHLKAEGVEFHPVDHGISWALYFNDPDGNGCEIFLDTRKTSYGHPEWQGRNFHLELGDETKPK